MHTGLTFTEIRLVCGVNPKMVCYGFLVRLGDALRHDLIKATI
jgi:hypothetical protein